MPTQPVPYNRMSRILARLDFSWGASGSKLGYIAKNGLWMSRFRPGGPHALWIAGHLSYYEGAARKLYEGLDSNPLEDWKGLFGNGSPCLDDAAAYPDPASVLETLKSGRSMTRSAIASLSELDLDRTVLNERLAIQDLQSQIEFLIWHDAHHGAQLGAIVSEYKDSLTN